MTPTRIYVAGASKEIELIEAILVQLRKVGHLITMDWCAAIRTAGGIATPDDEMACRIAAGNDYNGVAQCEIFWLVAPEVESTSTGAWVELGFAINMGKRTIVSGEWKRCIFARLTHQQFDEHEDALKYLVG